MVGLGFRVAILALGLGFVELALVHMATASSPLDWLALVAGLTLIVAGSAGFMVPILAGRSPKEDTDAR
jgi:hypothetical protein